MYRILSYTLMALSGTEAFLCAGRERPASRSTIQATDDETAFEASDIDPDVAGKFKILTCYSTSCAKKRKTLGLDEYSTFSAFWTRANDFPVPLLRVEEAPCLGSCQQGPCVAIEHDEYDGPVSLLGMTPNEFSARAFHNVVWEEDAERVWGCVVDSIRTMQEEGKES